MSMKSSACTGYTASSIVRIAPGEVHIDDLDFYDTLYALGVKRDKDPLHTQIFGTPLSLFGSEFHEVHKARRSAINPFFSRSSVLRLEPMIQQRVQQMCDRFGDLGKRGEPVLLRDAFVAVTIDIVTEYSFAKSADTLADPYFAPHWEKMMSGVTEAVPLAKALPGIVQVIQQLPLSWVRVMNPLLGSFFDYSNIIRDQVATAIYTHHATGSANASKDPEKPARTTVFQDLLESSLPPHEKSEERLTQEGVGMVSAAAETTSIALATTMFHVLSDPSLVARLRDEMRPAMPGADWLTLESLPLLTAIVKEGLRITTAICGRLPLMAPEPLQYREWTIPPNTSVSMSPRDALLNPTIFPNPKAFDPDRWLRPTSEAAKSQMNRAYLPFNKGSRMCLGFNLAYADIYHTISSLLSRFDLELVDTVRERDVDMIRDHFTAKAVRGSEGVKVRVVRVLSEDKEGMEEGTCTFE
ncbi:hypothetical protein MMC28_007601 [Mycoblastus sanguinarius]|nr:hypothetical protein [Mycoblastus sanguinarius]